MHIGKSPLIFLVLLTACLVGCFESAPHAERGGHSDPDESQPAVRETSMETPTAEQLAFVEEVRPKVEAFCGDCHAMPRPASSTREDWEAEVNQGFMLYGQSGRTDLVVPEYDDVLKFFQYQAPHEMVMPATIEDYPPAPVSLAAQEVSARSNRPPGVTNVRWIDLGVKDTPALVYCDIGTGAVNAHWPREPDQPTKRLATLLQPVHLEPCDLDGDGLLDLVAADIGEFNADDSKFGSVAWLRRKPNSDQFEKILLREDLARVADVQPGDFDADGDTDLLVGVFGWRETGRIFMLVNDGQDEDGRLRFSEREIDSRHGAVNVIPTDLNQDGKLDFVALLSQEHERVEAFLNRGDATFDKQLIWAAPDPAYGSSGIELVDLDQDGDLDVLYTNGDSFDRGPKPHHSVQWLENDGSYPFNRHHLCEMPGVLNATAGDFDSDGDLDVVAVSLLSSTESQKLAGRRTSSVVLLVQTVPGEFERTMVEPNDHNHISVEAGDFNDDGKVDFAVGTFLREGGQGSPDLVIWSNRQ
jgi:hypothetical protein